MSNPVPSRSLQTVDGGRGGDYIVKAAHGWRRSLSDVIGEGERLVVLVFTVVTCCWLASAGFAGVNSPM